MYVFIHAAADGLLFCSCVSLVHSQYKTNVGVHCSLFCNLQGHSLEPRLVSLVAADLPVDTPKTISGVFFCVVIALEAPINMLTPCNPFLN